MAPQGLDPVEVFESLPEKMQTCFKTGRKTGVGADLREVHLA